MIKSHSKIGRPEAQYRSSWGQKIDGLYKLKDGRWRASGPEKYTFSERDERLAVARFLQWKARQARDTIRIPQASGRTPDEIRAAALHMNAPVTLQRRPMQANVQLPEFINRAVTTSIDPAIELPYDPFTHPDAQPTGSTQRGPVIIERNESTGEIEFFREGNEAEAATFWAWLRHLIITRPEYVALKTGIEQIGYLSDLEKPAPSPTLTEVGDLFDLKDISENWKAKTRIFWKEFCDFVEVDTLREVTEEKIVEYADFVLAAMRDGDYSPTYARQRFQAVKIVLNYPPKRRKWVTDSKRVADFCSVLVPPKKSNVDPHPISPKHFNAMLDKATAQFSTMLLVMLNCCMYGGEVAALDWDEIDLDKGTIVTRRNKTSVIRVAVLWPETTKALLEMKKHRTENPYVFATNGTKMQHNYQTVYKAFKAARKLVSGAEKVQMADIRDGAYTAAIDAGVDLSTCKLLAGHSTGIPDSYVKRKPSMVAAACDAIRQFYGIARK